MTRFIEITLKGGKRTVNTSKIHYITPYKEGTGTFISLDGTSTIGKPNLLVLESYSEIQNMLIVSEQFIKTHN